MWLFQDHLARRVPLLLQFIKERIVALITSEKNNRLFIKPKDFVVSPIYLTSGSIWLLDNN